MLQLDSRAVVNLPRALRATLIAVLLLGLTVGVGTLWYYVRTSRLSDQPVYNDAVLLALSIVQVTLVGVVAALLVLYGETDATTDDLRRRTKDFLTRHLPDSLRKVSPDYGGRARGCEVRQLGDSDVFGAAYELAAASSSLKLWVGINVTRLIVIYWVEGNEQTEAVPAADDAVNALRHVFRFTFGGAENVGFATQFEPAVSPQGRAIVSVWSTVRAEENLLTNPAARLFWAQDLAMMTESFWRTAVRNGIALSREEPCPL